MDGPAAATSRYRVLVVDDVAINRLIAVELLGRLGIDAVEATDGVEALAAVQELAFDLILMDIHMPGMDGLACAAAIRCLPPPVATIPIIAITTGDDTDAPRYVIAGMDDFLAKPVRLESFTAKILKWLPEREPKT